LWRAASDGRPEILERAVRDMPRLRETGRALASFIAHDDSVALNRILAAEEAEGADGTYWLVRLLIERQAGADETRSLSVGPLLAPGIPRLASGAALPVDAFGGGQIDLWGYRRLPVRHEAATNLVSSQQGLVTWLTAGFRAAR
jgi:hypothetical protein